ncbi:MAG: type II toxin-antitoxin system VapC family toxin [Chloroflexi bacterium]|nr:type II toxin-antitoxin system VapC family toxin [Chloroflexota bacterium]MCC6896179.1 type II toxin-antitoxin system VapC family toxin [Anaerolineae bacterium]
MRYLLDTAAFLWWVGDSRKLSERVFRLIQHAENEMYLSAVCIREIQIKAQIGRLDLPTPILEIVERQYAENNVHILPIQLNHMYAFNLLPNHHPDPFDRTLIAQAIAENMPIITNDPMFAKYPVETIW